MDTDTIVNTPPASRALQKMPGSSCTIPLGAGRLTPNDGYDLNINMGVSVSNRIHSFLSAIGLTLWISACGSGGSTGTPTPNPSIEAVAGTPTLLGTTMFDLGTVGYEQSEYFISGTAHS